MREAIGWRGDMGGSHGSHGRFAMAAPNQGRKEMDQCVQRMVDWATLVGGGGKRWWIGMDGWVVFH